MTNYTKVYIETDTKGRMCISAEDDAGAGGGYRLAGPKYCGCHPGDPVVRVDLDEYHVREIRRYLEIWDEIQARQTPPAEVST